MSNYVIPFALDTYRASGAVEIGIKDYEYVHPDFQGRKFRIGKLRAAVGKGEAVCRFLSGSAHRVTPTLASSTANMFYGIAQVSAPAGAYAWFQFFGRGRVAAKATGVIAHGTKLTWTENGKLGAATTTATQHNAVGFGQKSDAAGVLAAGEYFLGQ